MDYEEKYKEALEKAKRLYEEGTITESLCYIFPELKESEGERIRTGLINGFNECLKSSQYSNNAQKYWHNIKIEDIFSWLEKQGEKERDEWKEGNIIRHGGILALVIKGRRAIKSNGEIFTVQYPDEWVKASPNEIERFFNNFEKQGEPNTVVVIPKFREGDVIRHKGSTEELTIESISGECYHGKGWGLHISCDDDYELVKQKPSWNEEG